MSNLANVVGAVIGLAAINKLLDRDDKVTPVVAPKPLIKEGFVTGPAAGVQDFTLIKPMVKLTPEQVAAPIPTAEQQAFTRERLLAPSGTPEQAALIAQAYRPGKIVKFGTGVSIEDLLKRQMPRK